MDLATVIDASVLTITLVLRAHSQLDDVLMRILVSGHHVGLEKQSSVSEGPNCLGSAYACTLHESVAKQQLLFTTPHASKMRHAFPPDLTCHHGIL